MLGVAATIEVGSWIAWLLVGAVSLAWIAVRVYDLVSADSESWRLLSGVNRIVSSLLAAGVYAVTLPFSWAFIRG
ncbi:hypothetical protein ASE16_03200 [Leifsonia sp. Root227]|nr:hypothetical protein ASE16_03200 [Leifsonia sp. Root227]